MKIEEQKKTSQAIKRISPLKDPTLPSLPLSSLLIVDTVTGQIIASDLQGLYEGKD